MDLEANEGPSNRTYLLSQMITAGLILSIFNLLNSNGFFDENTNLFFIISTSLILGFAVVHNILLMFVPEEDENS